jgi:hypothetical protein
MTSHISEGTKHAVDALSVATVIGTLAQILPSIAALFTIVWTSFRIYELRTIQKWLGKGVKDEEAND